MPDSGLAHAHSQALNTYSVKVPPGWRNGIPGYPFTRYLQLVQLWHSCTDLSEAQEGPLLAGRLQGAPLQIALRIQCTRPATDDDGHVLRETVPPMIDPQTGIMHHVPGPAIMRTYVGPKALCLPELEFNGTQWPSGAMML